MNQINGVTVNNHVGGRKYCTNCFETKPITEFSISSRNKNGTASLQSKCKPCRSIINSQRDSRKKATKNPHRYIECDECAYVCTKFVGATTVKHVVCPKCGSSEIGEFSLD